MRRSIAQMRKQLLAPINICPKKEIPEKCSFALGVLTANPKLLNRVLNLVAPSWYTALPSWAFHKRLCPET